jgi:hypothetical protein
MVDIGKDKLLYLYLDNESMTGYVGETKDLKTRHRDHKYDDYIYEDKWSGRHELVSNIDPVIIKTDFKNMNAVKFAEHAVYEKYKAEGYDMLQRPPHPNIFKKYHDRVDDCKICDELGCDFTKERLEYILAVHRVSKLCPVCNKPFYYDSKKHGGLQKFNKQKTCSYTCFNKNRWNTGSYNVSKLCPVCNKPFYYEHKKHRALPVFNRQSSCSKSCNIKNLSSGSYNVSKLCEKCNKPFYYYDNKNALPTFNKLKYCSHDCSTKTGSENVSKLCPVCNKVFHFNKERHRGHARFNITTYCSISCSNTGRSYKNDPCQQTLGDLVES